MVKKTDDDFFNEVLSNNLALALELREIDPECTDNYNDRSILKLICIEYWVRMFARICDKQLRKRYGYDMVYVDTMAGSGLTSTKRAGDYFAGSCPSAIKSAKDIGCPFDTVIAVEIDKNKAATLGRRLNNANLAGNTMIVDYDISDVANGISNHLQKNNTVSFIVIDPQALQGMTWATLKPLLSCKGDAMVTWFENEAWRLRTATVTKNHHKAMNSNIERLDELFGESWRDAESASELTDIFISRVLTECVNKTAYSKVKISHTNGYHWMILFAGNFQNAHKLVEEWRSNVSKRFESAHGKDISSLLDVKSGRQRSLYGDFS